MTISAQHKDELIEARNQSFTTHRSTVPALEDILSVPLPVLDHGFVRVVDYMGDDAAVVQAARVSYGRGTKKSLQDQGLINYLMSHRHTTPFEMCEIKYHLKLPIFIARQWIRHRTASVNEYSARYSILNKEFYIPAPEHLAVQSTVNRQGRTDTLTGEESARVLDLLRRDAELVYEHYQEMLNADEHDQILDANRSGLTRELARINLTLNYYTEWYWKIDLHNLMHFLSLRADHHAQYEIRAYAEVMLDTVAKWVPKSFAAFKKYKMNAMLISEPSIRLIKQLIKGQKISYNDADMSKREWQEFLQAFDIEMAE